MVGPDAAGPGAADGAAPTRPPHLAQNSPSTAEPHVAQNAIGCSSYSTLMCTTLNLKFEKDIRRSMSRRTEDKLRHQRAGGGAGHQRRGARAQKVDQQAGERANPGADDGDHQSFDHGYFCSGRIPVALPNSNFSY